MAGTKQEWFQVEFLSSLEEGLWVPLFGRSPTLEDARRNRRHLTGKPQRKLLGDELYVETRIVKIERTVEVIE